MRKKYSFPVRSCLSYFMGQSFDICKGLRMNLVGLLGTYGEGLRMHKEHPTHDLVKIEYTVDWFRQYHKHLG